MTATPSGRMLPTPPDPVQVATTGVERVEPADVVRQRIRLGDPPPLDPPETIPTEETRR